MITALWGILFFLAAFAYLQYQLAIRVASLPVELSDRAMAWLGRGAEQLGENDQARANTNVLVGGVKTVGQKTPGAAAAMMKKTPGGDGGNEGGNKKE